MFKGIAALKAVVTNPELTQPPLQTTLPTITHSPICSQLAMVAWKFGRVKSSTL